MNQFNSYQYSDLEIRKVDLYANTKYQIILDYLKNQPPSNILNVGCGSGELSFLLAEMGHTVVSIDPVSEYIDLANRTLEKDYPHLTGKCTFRVGLIEDILEVQKYDCVIATDVLEHIEDDKKMLRDLFKIIRPLGKIFITVPALPSLFGYHDKSLGHFRRYTKNSLKQLAERIEPLKIEKIRYFGFFMIPICFLYSKILKKDYPVSQGSNSFLSFILRFVLKVEERVSFPLGTSLVFYGTKSEETKII